MIEKTVYDYLKTALSPTPVVMEQPKAAVSKFVLIQKTGGGSKDKIESATFAIQSYDTTLFGAATLNAEVIGKMSEITTLNSVSACRLDSDYNFTDTTEKRYRYQAVFNLTY